MSFLQSILAWLKDNDLAATWAEVSGFVITIVGFGVTFAGVYSARSAARRAEEASKATRDSMRLFDAVTDITSAIGSLEEIKRIHRSKPKWAEMPARYSVLRRQLISIRDTPLGLDDHHRSIVQNTIANLSSIEKRVDKSLETAAPLSVSRFNAMISDDLDQLIAALTYLKVTQEKS